MYRIQLPRGLAQRVARQQHELEIWENNTASGVFDPTFTTSVSTSIQWISSDGYSTVTTGTSHALSYTVPASGTRRWIVRCAAGLGAITAAECNTDAISQLKNLLKTKITSALLYSNSLVMRVSDLPMGTYSYIYLFGNSGVSGTLSEIASRNPTHISVWGCNITGSLTDINANAQICQCQIVSTTGITPASIAHLVEIRDLRIFSMGWSAANNDTVLLSAWNARVNYTYASTIVLHIGTPTGTPGTEPPAAGESNSNWSWNGTRHVPLTGYAVISDLQNDYYAEGFKLWSVTIH